MASSGFGRRVRASTNEGSQSIGADLCRPRKVLNLLLKQQAKKPEWLAENGSTPEALLKSGWHVVRMHGPSIAELGFTLEAPSKSGHLNVVGSKEDLERSAFDLIELADDVPVAEFSMRP